MASPFDDSRGVDRNADARQIQHTRPRQSRLDRILSAVNPEDRRYKEINREINVGINIGLIVVIALLSTLIILLYTSARVYGLLSLTSVVDGGLEPSTLVSFLTTVLVLAVEALCTRWVEHYAWIKASEEPKNECSGLPIEEMGLLTNWSISPIGRLNYLLSGNSRIIRVAAIPMFFLLFLGPVILQGINPRPLTYTEVSRFGSGVALYNEPIFKGWVESMTAPSAGVSRDELTEQAALVQLNETDMPDFKIPKCVHACVYNVALPVIQAECRNKTDDNTAAPVGLSGPRDTSRKFASSWSKDVSVSLAGGQNPVLANFTTLSSTRSDLPEGVFGYIFGAWVMTEKREQVQVVDCRLRFGAGFATIRNNDKVLNISRVDFEPFKQRADKNVDIDRLRKAYLDPSNMFDFSASPPDKSEKAAKTEARLASSLLLGLDKVEEMPNSADVAGRIESIWDVAATLAWIDQPDLVNQGIIVNTLEKAHYVYSPWWMLSLVMPLLAIVLVALATGSRVVGKSIMLSYDPVMIASHGPIVDGTRDSLGPAQIDDNYGFFREDIPEHSRVYGRSRLALEAGAAAKPAGDGSGTDQSRWIMMVGESNRHAYWTEKVRLRYKKVDQRQE